MTYYIEFDGTTLAVHFYNLVHPHYVFALELRSIERNCCYNLVGDRYHRLMLHKYSKMNMKNVRVTVAFFAGSQVATHT